eukprot:TRINITY_DN8930_c0_g1_i1.p1 TRINITY_DN8930_c0_g1~~TRINITY_DN8930_c0_g1_i1.p1  ORF type:complete len:338 (+),score=51.29 TRINITY_DN8930_c0_g1_i1:48-1016(+)
MESLFSLSSFSAEHFEEEGARENRQGLAVESDQGAANDVKGNVFGSSAVGGEFRGDLGAEAIQEGTAGGGQVDPSGTSRPTSDLLALHRARYSPYYLPSSTPHPDDSISVAEGERRAAAEGNVAGERGGRRGTERHFDSTTPPNVVQPPSLGSRLLEDAHWREQGPLDRDSQSEWRHDYGQRANGSADIGPSRPSQSHDSLSRNQTRGPPTQRIDPASYSKGPSSSGSVADHDDGYPSPVVRATNVGEGERKQVGEGSDGRRTGRQRHRHRSGGGGGNERDEREAGEDGRNGTERKRDPKPKRRRRKDEKVVEPDLIDLTSI